jgi:hypothetical protein
MATENTKWRESRDEFFYIPGRSPVESKRKMDSQNTKKCESAERSNVLKNCISMSSWNFVRKLATVDVLRRLLRNFSQVSMMHKNQKKGS